MITLDESLFDDDMSMQDSIQIFPSGHFAEYGRDSPKRDRNGGKLSACEYLALLFDHSSVDTFAVIIVK